jgi:PIN domain nuclease of toxin-antitoxin system
MGSDVKMRYLLDTHIWLWSLLEPDRMEARVLAILQDDDNELFISPITVWETLILAERGTIELLPTPGEWIAEALDRSPVMEAKLTHAVALKSRRIVLPHQDPADRFIAATAWEYGMTLITADQRLKAAREIQAM